MANYNKEDLLVMYKELCIHVGKVAGTKDINQCRDLPHSDTIRRIFGSVEEFQSLSGMKRNNEISGKPLKEIVEKTLIKKRIEKGRRLDRIEINNDKDLPYAKYITRIYGKKSIGEIWEEIESKIPRVVKNYLEL